MGTFQGIAPVPLSNPGQQRGVTNPMSAGMGAPRPMGQSYDPFGALGGGTGMGSNNQFNSQYNNKTQPRKNF